MQSLVSVIVPVFKVEEYLRHCLDSLSRQSLSDIEIILIDDASPDRCGTICEEYASVDKRFRVIHHEVNRGLSAARNTGIQKASSEYLMFVDSDDSVDVDYCKEPYECAVAFQADLVMFNYVHIKNLDEFGNKAISKPDSSQSGFKSREEAMALINGNVVGPFAWNKLYKKEIFRDISYPEGYLYEDMGTTYKTIWKATNIYYLDNVLYYQNGFRSGRITGLRNEKAFRDWYELYMQQYRDLTDWGYSREKLDALLKHIAFGYCIMKRKDMFDPDYVSCRNMILSCKDIPSNFTQKRKLLFLSFKYCPTLFEFICIRSGKKFC